MRVARRTRLVASFLVAIAGAAVFTACGGDDSDKGTPSSTTAAKPEIEITDLRGKASGGQYPEVDMNVIDNQFDPPGIRIDAGVTVNWTNNGRVDHNIIVSSKPDGAAADFGANTNQLRVGMTYSYRFDQPGTYRFYCSLHGAASSGMVGAVVVGDGEIDAQPSASTNTSDATTLRVPKDFATIQEAVDAAKPGALVLVAPGTYNEAVTVTSPDIVIRGEDRNTTVLDGEFSEEPGKENGFKVLADGVAIENITAMNYRGNAFFWTGVDGYRGSYLTSYRTGDYGVYAFDSVNGQFDNSYAAGSSDAGYYIGQCYPCNAVITDSEAEWNGLGYSGTNAGGELYLVNSSYHDNRAGIVPNSGTGEKLYPQRGTTIVGNRVYSNNNGKTPAIDIAQLALGNGILLAGGSENVVERNLVFDHDITGIAAIPLPEKLINPDNANAINFDAKRNVIRNNVVRDSRGGDLALVATLDSAEEIYGNCFSGNTYKTTLPANFDVEKAAPCDGKADPAFKTDLAKFAELLTRSTPGSADYRTAELPPRPKLANMPDALNAPARPANQGVPVKIDIDAIVTPEK